MITASTVLILITRKMVVIEVTMKSIEDISLVVKNVTKSTVTCLLFGCMTSELHGSVSQGRMCVADLFAVWLLSFQATC